MRPLCPRTRRASRRARLFGPLPLAALLLAALLAGCGGSDADSDADSADDLAGALPAAGTATRALPPAAANPTEVPGALSLGAWAAAACVITDSFIGEFLATGDDIDPEALDLAARKERAAGQFPGQIAATERAAAALNAMIPPRRSEQLHQLLTASFADLAVSLEEQRGIVAAAPDTTAIAISNRAVQERRDVVFRQAQLLQEAVD